MKLKYSILKSIVLLTLPLLMFSCDDDDNTLNDVPDQLFRPILLSATINNGNEVTLSWIPIANASSLLEISRDTFLFQNELQTFSLDGVSQYTIKDLWSNSTYSARIKAVSKDSNIKDSEFDQMGFTTQTENIFYAVTDDQIGTDYVLLKWDNSKNVSQLVLSADGGTETTIALSESDISGGQKLVEGLNPDTEYVFKIYLGEMLRGTISVKTQAQP
tara:strand:+ start:19582 stop:20232 length:651 start_codon:yes stop_codon:yes gene_type:complete